jgi:hypothetical protein
VVEMQISVQEDVTKTIAVYKFMYIKNISTLGMEADVVPTDPFHVHH